MYKSLIAGQNVYVKRDRHKAVLYSIKTGHHIEIAETIFAYYSTDTGNCPRLVLLCSPNLIDPEPGNVSVVKTFGNRRYAYSLSSAYHIQKKSSSYGIITTNHTCCRFVLAKAGKRHKSAIRYCLYRSCPAAQFAGA